MEKKIEVPIEDAAAVDEKATAEETADATDIEEVVAVPSSLESELQQLQDEAEVARDRMLRAAAEFENYKRRAEREKQEQSKYMVESFMLDLLPVLDNLERALASATEDASNTSIREGVTMIHQQLLGVLEKRGVKQLEAAGQKFDPVFHEAMAKLPSDAPEDTIIEVFQQGYLLYDRVIRPARVIVSQGPDKPQKGSPEN